MLQRKFALYLFGKLQQKSVLNFSGIYLFGMLIELLEDGGLKKRKRSWHIYSEQYVLGGPSLNIVKSPDLALFRGFIFGILPPSIVESVSERYLPISGKTSKTETTFDSRV